MDDWASLPVLILPPFVLSFRRESGRERREPAFTNIRRTSFWPRSDAWVDAGIWSQQAARSFSDYRRWVDLADSDPNPADVFLFYSHPTIADRVRFALAYDPWSLRRQGGANLCREVRKY